MERISSLNTLLGIYRDLFADNKGKSLEDAIQSMLLGTFMLIPGIITCILLMYLFFYIKI